MLRIPGFVKVGGNRRTHMTLLNNQSLGGGRGIVTIGSYSGLRGHTLRRHIGPTHVDGCHQRHGKQTQCRKRLPWTNPSQ